MCITTLCHCWRCCIIVSNGWSGLKQKQTILNTFIFIIVHYLPSTSTPVVPIAFLNASSVLVLPSASNNITHSIIEVILSVDTGTSLSLHEIHGIMHCIIMYFHTASRGCKILLPIKWVSIRLQLFEQYQTVLDYLYTAIAS